MDNLTRFVTLQGAPLYYETRGDGPPVLLIHAGVADSRMWDAQWETLSADYRLIRFDMRGWGRSTPLDGTFTHHDDVRLLLDHLGIASAHVVGVSFGGRVALDFALAYPERVRSLILGAPSVGGSEAAPEVEAFGEQEDGYLEAGDLAAATQLNVDFWVIGPVRAADEVDAAVRESVYAMQQAAFEIVLPSNFEPRGLKPPAIGRLGEIRVPTLVLVGDADQPSAIEMARRAAAEIPGAQLIVRPNVGHMVTMERPLEADAHISTFLTLYKWK
jgi:pimeloyl-ACP methyl ester carboxylesterase